MGVIGPGVVFRFAACSGVLACAALLHAQTADPNATPPGPTSAPAAKAGTYAVTQGDVIAAPGLIVPNGNLPWALDTAADGRPALVPLHHASVDEPSSDPGGASSGEHTLSGVHGHSVLRSSSPTFYIHGGDRTENTGDAGRGNPTGWVLVEARTKSGNRVIPHVQFSQIAAGTSCATPLFCLKAESLPDGWVRLTPVAALAPGEYVLVPVHHTTKPGTLVVYDFTQDPTALLAKDAVTAGAATQQQKRRVK